MKVPSFEKMISNSLLVVGVFTCITLVGCETGNVIPNPVSPVHTYLPGTVTLTPSAPGAVVVPGSSAPGCSPISNSFVADHERLVGSFNRASCAQIQYCIKPEFWKTLPQVSYIPGIDLVIVFDVTGSMTPYIQAMISNMQRLIGNLQGLSPNLRLGLVSYQDFADKGGSRGDVPFKLISSLTEDTASVSLALSKLRASGGGDIPESLATAVKATVDGKSLGSYFTASDMKWNPDPSRIKIVLAITDASNKATNLPVGAPSLADTAALLKEKGILFLGIGRKNAPGTPVDPQWSYSDLASLASSSGAIVRAPGIDLDGDGVANTFGEAKAGEPAVLLMDSTGHLVGAPNTSDPTKILADAITQMVKRVQPYKVDLKVLANGRTFRPTVNTLAIPPDFNSEICFSDIQFDSVASFDSSSCPANSNVEVSANEELTSSLVDSSFVRANMQVSDTCNGVSNPVGPVEPNPTGTPPPALDPVIPPNQGGGAVGV